MGNFLSRDMPGAAIKLILKYLDLRAANVVKRLFIKSIDSSSMWNRGEGSRGVLEGFGSKARLAMTVLSNRLRPFISELKPVRSSKSIDNIPFNCIELSLQAAGKSSPSDTCADNRAGHTHTAIPIHDEEAGNGDHTDQTGYRCTAMARNPIVYIYYALSCIVLLIVLWALQSP